MHQIRRDNEAIRAVCEARRAEWRALAMSRLLRWVEAQDAAINGVTPAAERAAWAEKEAAAYRVLDGTALGEDAAIIEAECALTGEAPLALAEKVIRAAQRHRSRAAMSGAVFAGARRAAAKALEGVTNPEMMEPVVNDAISAAATALRAAMESIA